jgi:hypothetical protein
MEMLDTDQPPSLSEEKAQALAAHVVEKLRS